MKIHIFLIMLSIGLLDGCSKTSEASGYEIVKGKGIEVCEAYRKNLNRFKPPVLQQCRRKIHPLSESFSKPDNKRFYTTDKMMEKIDRFLWERDANPAYYISMIKNGVSPDNKEQMEKARIRYLDNRNRRMNIGHRIALVDIDNDGDLDNVYIDRACNAFGSILMVLNKDKTNIDTAKTELVMRHPSRKEAGWPNYHSVKKDDWGVPPSFVQRGYMQTPDALHDVFYDVFSYKGQTYFDQWWGRHIDFKGKSQIDVGKLRVYTIKNNKTKRVCTLKYQMTKIGNSK